MNVNNRYFTVSKLTDYIKGMMDRDSTLQNVWLKGEISNFRHHNRWHMYLTLKDDNARVKAVMFGNDNRFLKFTPENGMNVIVQGNVSVYKANGEYQVYIRKMEPDGIGSLYLAYEQLKEKLLKEGLFDQVHKRSIPEFPKKIGIITSPTGAAVRDIITTIKRRFSTTDLTVIPATVQGNEAGKSIVTAIELANENGDFDTLIVGRGGGSIEDLWGFNEEIVARAIHHSNIPVISAVGHETDTTISDLVADLRAPTPTAAAELAVPSQLELKQHIDQVTAHLTKALQLQLAKKKETLQQMRNSYAFHYPKHALNENQQKVDRLTESMSNLVQTMLHRKKQQYQELSSRVQLNHPGNRINVVEQNMQQYKRRLNERMTHILQQSEQKLANNIDKLTLLNPLHIMQRGFSVAYNEERQIIKSVAKIKNNDYVSIQVTDGTINCRVQDIEEDE